MPDYSKDQPESNVSKVTTGTVTVKQKSEGKKFVESFVEEDAHSIGTYVKEEILIPTFKDLISSIITNSIEMLLYGNSARPRGHSGGGYTNYNRVYDRDVRNYSGSRRLSESSSSRRTVSPRGKYYIKDLGFDSRADADAVLDALLDHLQEYDQVTVGDYYSACDVTPEWTDFRYGWDSLNSARVERSRGEYIIVLPRPISLD